jgi:hypothetical protein
VLWLPADRIIAGNDLINMFLPWLRFAVSSLQQGQLPLWNPYFFSGLPFVANPQPALFYPPTWLALLMPVTRALGLIVVLHLWLAGAGMYAWLRSEGASVSGALLAGVIFTFSGYFFVRVYAGHLGVVTTGAWLPFLLWVYRRVLARRSWRLAVVGGLPVGLSILAGHTASFIYVALGLVAYAVFCAWERLREGHAAQEPGSVAPQPLRFPRLRGDLASGLLPLAWVGVMLLVGLALAAVQLVPMAQLALRSTRQSTPTYEFAARFSWPPGYLLTLLVPNFFGEPAQTGYWGDGIYDEFIFYVGVLPLLLALLGLRLRYRLTPFLSVLGLGALLLAFGKYGSLHRLVYRFVPLFRVARAPARAGFLFTLTVAALAGMAVTALESSTYAERRRLLEPLSRSWVLMIAGGTAALIVAGFLAFALGREDNPAAGRLWHQANQAALFLLFFLLSVGLLAAWRRGASSDARKERELDAPEMWESGARGRREVAGLWLLALGLVIVDLWTFGGGRVESVDVQENAYWRIVAQAVPDPQAARVLPWGLGSFEQNGGMAFGLRSIFGYDPLTLQRYKTFVDSLPDPRARTYDLLNAGYLVTTAPQEFPAGPDVPSLLLEQSGVYVYERPGALPRAWVVPRVEVVDDASALARIHEPDFDPRTTALVDVTSLAPAARGTVECVYTAVEGGGQAEIVRYEENRIEARVQGGGGLLVFSEVDYPGWQATVDGDPVPLVRADYLLRALCVPPGEHRVVLTYDPPLLKVGLAITALALFLVCGSTVGCVARREC